MPRERAVAFSSEEELRRAMKVKVWHRSVGSNRQHLGAHLGASRSVELHVYYFRKI